MAEIKSTSQKCYKQVLKKFFKLISCYYTLSPRTSDQSSPQLCPSRGCRVQGVKAQLSCKDNSPHPLPKRFAALPAGMRSPKESGYMVSD